MSPPLSWCRLKVVVSICTGTDVFFETSAGFEEIIDFFTNALEPPLDVRTEDGVDRAIWVYKPGVEHIAIILESDAEGVHVKVSGLF